MKKIALIISDCQQSQEAAKKSLEDLGAELKELKASEISELQSKDFDALVLSGRMEADDASVKSLIQNFHNDSSPIGAIGAAPLFIVQALAEYGVAITIGNDKEVATELEKLGAQHVDCEVDDFITDRQNKVVTTPATMCKANPEQISTGIQKAMAELYEMA